MLYHDGCRLSLAARQVSGSVASITTDGLTVVVAAAAAQLDGYYSAGVFEFGGRQEMILSHVGSTLKLASPVPGLLAASPGDRPCKIAPGCDLTRTTCNDRFANLDNFGGFPWLTETPFDGRSIV